MMVFSRCVFFFFLFFTLLTAQAQPDGNSLFKTNCAQCHGVTDKVVIGPGLKGINERHSEEWLLSWIKNSQALISSGDPEAVKVFNQFNKLPMPNFNLSDDEIRSILTYVDEAAAAVPAPVAGTPGGVAGEQQPVDYTNWMITAAIILGILLFILTRVKNVLIRLHREKQGLPPLEPVPAGRRLTRWMGGNKKLVAVIVIVLLVVGMKEGWDALAGIGVYTGYQPEQPIAFSHKVHAGDNAISCNYCHSGAEKGKTAGIPSASVCMNCHRYIEEGPNTGKGEIAKIYAALDYDPATQTYGPKQKPIEWVRVHNLPDHAYFNHAQHVNVAGVECQTCHGQVQEMTVAQQVSPLTMGWCIDCHRNTEVKMEGNAYYDKVHEDLIRIYGSRERITVEKIGGMECAKCHY